MSESARTTEARAVTTASPAKGEQQPATQSKNRQNKGMYERGGVMDRLRDPIKLIPAPAKDSPELIKTENATDPPPDDPYAEFRRRLELRGPAPALATVDTSRGDGGGGRDRDRDDRDRGGDDGGERGRIPPESPEWLHSPERGRMIIEEIAWRETTQPYEIRYNRENGPRLNELYDELIAYVEGLSETRYDVDPFNPHREHLDIDPNTPRPELIEVMVEAYQDRIERIAERANQDSLRPPEDFTGVDPLNVLVEKYKNGTPAERPQVEEDLLKYFREARRKGLLKGVDENLNSLYLRYKGGGVEADRARRLLRQDALPNAATSGESAVRRKRGDPEVNPRLVDVWQAYLLWAGDRFESLLDGEEPADFREGEWRFPDEGDEGEVTETFWEPSAHYPKYYEITAQNPDQFRIATQSFLQMIKNKGLGYAPDELMQHYAGFKDKLGAVGGDLVSKQKKQPDGPNKMTDSFMEELRQEFEGQFLIWYADYNNDVYNKDGWKQGMTAMALHEGPQRWVGVARSGDGEVGKYSFQFDNEALMEFAINAQGSRGQLGDRSQVQNYMRGEIMTMMKERGMGVVLKNYDWRDPFISDPSVRLMRARYLERIEKLLGRNNNDLSILSDEDRAEYFKIKQHSVTNRNRIVLHQSEEGFKSLYEGFETDERGFIRGDAHLRNYEMFQQLGVSENELPPDLRRSVRLGRIQNEINILRVQVREREIALGRNETLVGKLVELKRINNNDKRAYEDAFANSEYNFGIAFQMQGASQEKAVRGGGVLFINRNKFVREYLKVRKSNESKGARGKVIPSDNDLSYAQRKARWTKDQHIGWILNEIKSGKRVDTLDPAEIAMYQGLDPQEQQPYFDNLPVHLAVKFAQTAVNWTKMRYADDADIWQRPDLAAFIHTKDANGNYLYPNFRAVFRNAMVDRARNMAIDQIAANGYESKLYYTDFEATSFDPETKKITVNAISEARPMMLKRPTGDVDPETGKMVVDGTESVHLDFDKAVNSYLALHTTHTYWAYQNNNTHTLLPEYVLQQARDIRDGKLRPEDADIFAGLLLTLDPTLCRAIGFSGEQMAREGIVFDAAVEDSYMSWVDIKKGINQKFSPKDGNPDYMSMGYYTEDWGGEGRFTLQIESLVAKMPKRWSRRFAAALGITPMYVSTMADNVGRKGVLGAVSMMADKISGISGQRILSQFGITKFINFVDSGSELWFSLIGGIDPKTGLHKEGVFMKPTNNNDKLQQLRTRLANGEADPSVENQLLYELMESFGRVDTVLKVIRKMYSDGRNAGGALKLNTTDILLPDGRYNPAIAKDRSTGSSRHIAKMFWDAYVEWLLDEGPGGGVETYSDSAPVYKFLKERYFYWDGKNRKHFDGRTWSDWLFDKMAL